MSHPGAPGRDAVPDVDPARIAEDELDEERASASHGGTWRPGTLRRHRRWWVLGGLAVLAGCVLAAVWGWSATRGVQFTNTGFDVLADDRIVVQFDATREPGREIVCVLRAQAVDHSNVGRTEVVVPASTQRTTRQRFEMRTSTRAVTGFVDSCRYR